MPNESKDRCEHGCIDGTITAHAPKCDGYTCAPDCPIPQPCPDHTPVPVEEDEHGEA